MVVVVNLLQGRHLCRQPVLPWSTTGLQPVLPLILQHVILQLILWGHNVICPWADVVQDGTCCYDLKWKTIFINFVLLCFKKQTRLLVEWWRNKGTLNDSTCPGMMAVEALGCHTLHWPLVGSDEREWMLEAWVPTVCEDEVPWRRVDRPPLQWAVP